MLWTCSTAKIRASGVTFLLSALPVPSEEDGLKPAPQGRMLVSAVQRALLLADPRKPLADPSRYPDSHPFPFFNNPNSPRKSVIGTPVVLIKEGALAKQKSSSPPGSLPSRLAHERAGHESQCPALNVV